MEIITQSKSTRDPETPPAAPRELKKFFDKLLGHGTVEAVLRRLGPAYTPCVREVSGT